MRISISLILVLGALSLLARPPLLSEKQMSHHPAKVIRTCCAFGSDLRYVGVPFVKRTDIISTDELGQHHYLSNKNEGNGIIYTHKGGFIDIGHLRDYADWTAYLYLQIITHEDGLDDLEIKLGNEGGRKTLDFNDTGDLDSLDYYELAGRISYDLSLWHEIATYFGVSLIPGISEEFSSFSPEDVYSNLLGVRLGIKALKSKLEYNEAMTLLISEEMNSLNAVATYDQTLTAMAEVESIWWSSKKALPKKKFLLKRHLDANPYLIPMLLPKEVDLHRVRKLYKPAITYSEYYDLTIRLNNKFPKKEIFGVKRKTVSQKEFGVLVEYIDEHDWLLDQDDSSDIGFQD